MATINSLPLELLDLVLQELVQPLPSWADHLVRTPQASGSTITVDLCAASLVCRAWRYPAQAALFRNVIIPMNGVDGFLASPARARHPTWYLWFDDFSGAGCYLGPLFDEVSLLRELSVGDLSGVSWEFLYSASLANLESLEISYPGDLDEPSPDSVLPGTAFPFQLTSLSLTLDVPLPTALVRLFAVQTSINRLSITLIGDMFYEEACIADAKAIVRGIGGSLRSFNIVTDREAFTFEELDTPSILTIGSQYWSEHWNRIADANLCSALSSLAPSPPTLRHLRITHPFISLRMREIIRPPALAALESLEFVKVLERVSVSGRLLHSGLADEDDPEDLPDYEGWLEELEGRGVRVKIAGQ